MLSSPSKDQCVLVILVLDIAQPNKKLRIHLKRGVRNEFDLGGAFTLHLPFSRRSDPFILIAPLASGNGTWSECFLFHVLDPKDKYFSRNVIDLCGAINDDQANRHQGWLQGSLSFSKFELSKFELSIKPDLRGLGFRGKWGVLQRVDSIPKREE